MFKELSLEELKKSALIFNIDSPPTQEEINKRISCYPDMKSLSKKSFKKNFINGSVLVLLVEFVLSSIFWIVSKEMSWMFSMMFSSFFSLISLAWFIDHGRNNEYRRTINYIVNEKRELAELNQEAYEQIINFCKKSIKCDLYRQKIVEQGRTFIVKDFLLLKEYVEKGEVIQKNKELLFSNKKIFEGEVINNNVKEGYVI